MMVVAPGRFATVGGGPGTPPTYVGQTRTTPDVGPKTFTLPGGVQPGDWALVTLGALAAPSLGISGGDGGWTYVTDGGGVPERSAYKFLTAGDIAATLQAAWGTGYGFIVVTVYRGVVGVTKRAWGRNTSGTPYIVSGFTPAANSRVISVFRGNVSGSGHTVLLAPPISFTERVDFYDADGGSGMVIGAADSSSYAGTDISWGISSSVSLIRNSQTIFELTP